MEGARYEPHFEKPVQGVVIGDNATVTNIFQPAPSVASYRSIFGTPPPTDPSVIQQRTTLVETITTKLTQPNLNALGLTGIGGVGKSTLAALVHHAVEAQCQQATGPFTITPLWLKIDASTTFADIMGTIHQALGKPLPDLKSLSPANQAQSLCTLL